MKFVHILHQNKEDMPVDNFVDKKYLWRKKEKFFVQHYFT